MLDATIYIAALNHAAFTDESDASPERLKRIIDYCRAHGLRLATVPDGGLTVERDGMNPNTLHIAIDGYDGWAYRELRNRRARQYDWICPMYDEEARIEAMSQHWQERKNIERDYVERPW